MKFFFVSLIVLTSCSSDSITNDVMQNKTDSSTGDKVDMLESNDLNMLFDAMPDKRSGIEMIEEEYDEENSANVPELIGFNAGSCLGGKQQLCSLFQKLDQLIFLKVKKVSSLKRPFEGSSRPGTTFQQCDYIHTRHIVIEFETIYNLTNPEKYTFKRLIIPTSRTLSWWPQPKFDGSGNLLWVGDNIKVERFKEGSVLGVIGTPYEGSDEELIYNGNTMLSLYREGGKTKVHAQYGAICWKDNNDLDGLTLYELETKLNKCDASNFPERQANAHMRETYKCEDL